MATSYRGAFRTMATSCRGAFGTMATSCRGAFGIDLLSGRNCGNSKGLSATHCKIESRVKIITKTKMTFCLSRNKIYESKLKSDESKYNFFYFFYRQFSYKF
jgi:hypothetical protein